MVEANNYLKVSRGCAVIDTFPFNDTVLLSAAMAHKRAVECLDRTMFEVARIEKERAERRARKTVVRMSLYRPCEFFSGVLSHSVGMWRCPTCLAGPDDCRCG
jgi:hypothetical protein